jgi:hypothetical protein
MMRAANALDALRCYWNDTHHLDVIDGIWLAFHRDDATGVAAASSPAGLHWQLAEHSGFAATLARPPGYGRGHR